VIKTRRIRWAGYEACVSEGKVFSWFWFGNMGRRDHLEELDVDGRIILQWIFKTWDGEGVWIELIWLREGTCGRLL